MGHVKVALTKRAEPPAIIAADVFPKPNCFSKPVLRFSYAVK
jgi:hypothetical protein